MKIHTHTILRESGKHFEEAGRKVTIEYSIEHPHIDQIEKILSLLDMIPGVNKSETASKPEV